MVKIIGRTDVLQLMKENNAILIDVLSEEDFHSLHIYQAINIPLERIGNTCRKRFGLETPIIVHCSDESCHASNLAARKLQAFKFRNIFEYRGGKKDWKKAGLPMASGL